MQLEEFGLLSIKIGINMILTKCCSLMSPNSVWNMTPCMFWYGVKDKLNIYIGMITIQMSWIKGIGWSKYSGCKNLHIIQNGTLITQKVYRQDIWIFNSSICREHTWNRNNIVYKVPSMLFWLESDCRFLCHTQTMHCKETNASVIILDLEIAFLEK